MTRLSAARWRAIAVVAVAVLAVAVTGGVLTDLGPWYQGLQQPPWKPHDRWFGPAWTIIFALTGTAAVRAWETAPSGGARAVTVGLFLLNAAANIGWTLLFFTMRRPDLALWEVAVLWLTVAVPIVYVGRWSRATAALLAPYLVWVTFAATINLGVVRLNGPFGAA